MMTRRGMFPCHNLLCLALTGNQGRAPRKSGVLSWYQPTILCFLRKSHLIMSTPCTTPEHPRALIRTKKLLRRTQEDTMVGVHGPQRHHIGHELHLGQKPKLGGRYADNHTHLHIMFCRSIIYPCFVFFLLLFLFYFCFPKHKKTKNISVVSLWLSLWFFVFGLLNLLVSLLF